MFMRRYFAPDDETGAGEPSEGLTVDSAVQMLQERREQQAKEAEKPEKAEEQAEARPDEAAPAEETPDEGQDPVIEQEEETPPPNIEMPFGWGDADRAAWDALTPEAKDVILRREKQRDAGIRKRLSEADAAKKAADDLTAQLNAERQRLGPILQSQRNAILQQLVKQFPEVNPNDPNTLMRLALEQPERKVAFDTLWGQLDAVVVAERRHEDEQRKIREKEDGEFSEARVKRLLELDETLAKPENSSRFESEIVQFLSETNPYGKVDAERIRHYTAEELLMVRDAMKYRKALTSLKAKPKAETPPVVKPGASQGVQKSDQVVALEKRARTKGLTVDEAVQLRRLKMAESA